MAVGIETQFKYTDQEQPFVDSLKTVMELLDAVLESALAAGLVVNPYIRRSKLTTMGTIGLEIYRASELVEILRSQNDPQAEIAAQNIEDAVAQAKAGRPN